MSVRIGIDIGGTFTDFALVDEASGAVTLEKILTTPSDPSVAVLEGVRRLAGTTRVAPRDIRTIVHGSTLVTNAVIERRGVPTGMLVTRGFRDVLDIALERRYDLYDLRLRFPEPLVERKLRAEIGERMREDGASLTRPDLAEVEAAVRALVDEHHVQAVAVCFLHAFTNPAHEEEVAAFVRARFPGLYVSSSADILPYMREYERWTTTTVNAFVQPIVDRYLTRIESGLAELGFKGSFYVMTSSGGTVTADIARKYPVRMLESGPAAGVFMATHVGRTLDIADVLSFDMGGTTAKGAIVRGGLLHKKYELEVARVHEFKTGSGLPVRVPVVDMIEIGAGGGGIAEIDDRGVLRVGPRSAGAVPGPASYGRGGTAATLTDANVTLGYYNPAYFLGGTMPLDAEAAKRAIETGIGQALSVDVARAAWGIHETINEDVARAFRVHASDIGFDYRRCSMIAFGGSGPAHAARIARKLRIPKVVFPAGSGVMSAIGMLVSPLSYQLARTQRESLAGLTAERFGAQLRDMEQEAARVLTLAGIARADIEVERHLDMRYQGQGYEVEVRLPSATDPATLFGVLQREFASAYEKIFGLTHIDEPIEILHWKIDVSGPAPRFENRWHARRKHAGTQPRKGHRRAYFAEAGGYVDTPVYDRYAMNLETVVEGPALVEERESTCVVGVGDVARVDDFGNLVVAIGGRS